MINGKFIINTLKKIQGAEYLFDKNGVRVSAYGSINQGYLVYFNGND